MYNVTVLIPDGTDFNNPEPQPEVKQGEPLPHAKILTQLAKAFEPLNFEVLAFPQAEKMRQRLTELEADKESFGSEGNNPKQAERKNLKDQLEKLKLNQKHYIVLSIENVLTVAERNKWGLCKNNDLIYLYNGAYWASIDKEVFQKFLGEVAEKMGVPKFSAKFYQFQEQLYKQFMAKAHLSTPESNKDTVLVNLQNGTFEISHQGTKLRAFDRSDFLTYQLPFAYSPKAKAPIFEAYLNRVLPDIERQRVISEYLGYVFIKHGSNTLKEEKALILYGTGANGKSVFFEIIMALFGWVNVSNYSLQSLTEEKGFYRAKIINKLLNYCSEISNKLEASLFKNMVSGEPVEACLKYGQPFTMTEYAKFIFNCNELPRDVEHTNAYFRRFLIVPFDVTIPEAEQDKQLHQKIIASELSGVFNWVLQGLIRLLEQKRFSVCEAAQKSVEQYKNQSDSVKLFLDENGYEKHPDNYMLIKELYQGYRAFCMDDGFKPVNKSNFIKRLEGIGIVVSRIMYGNAAYIAKKNEPF